MLHPIKMGVAPYIYCVGVLMFASMQLLDSYDGDNFTIRRLRRQQMLGALLLLLSGAAMIGGTYHLPYMGHNEWVIIMMIAAVLELYSAFRIPAELRKEERKEKLAQWSEEKKSKASGQRK